MNILIIENEVYLSHSIAKSLMEIGHLCTMCVKFDDVVKKNNYDVILLSTSINKECVKSIKKVYKDSVLILLASYVNNDMLLDLLKNGADDYILKPFLVEHLVTKIEHYISYEQLKAQAISYSDYFEHTFSDVKYQNLDTSLKLPLFISASNPKDLEAYIYKYTNNYSTPIHFISLEDKDALLKIKNLQDTELALILDTHLLNKKTKEEFMQFIDGKSVIVVNNTHIDAGAFSTLDLRSDYNLFEKESIISIAIYVQYVIQTYQNTMTDVELSKRLGVSRKSIWDKRRRYGIVRK